MYLEIEHSGARRWTLRIVVHGRRRDIGLGGASWVTLIEARDKAAKLRKIAREGGDPLSERRRQATIPTFEQAARTVHADRAPTYRNAKHAAQWLASLEAYAFPHFGAMRVNVVDTPDVLRALRPIWTSTPETARRVRQRTGVVFDWAKAAGHRAGDNPVSGVKHGLPKHDREQKKHFAALPYSQIGSFVEQLRAQEGTAARALEFLILTAGRTGEVIGARPAEFDLKAGVWTIAAARMKAKREHRVPLSPRALEISREAIDAKGVHLFPGMKEGQPLSNMAMLQLLDRMERGDLTVHGFRSSFRDWTAEQTNYPREVCEMALAHAIGDKTEAAYRRGDLFEKRRRLMLEWAKYCEQRSKDATAG
jgi:integrase